LRVQTELDAVTAQRSVRTAAVALGFDHNATEEIALAVSELVSNLLKHARHGMLSMRPLDLENSGGIEVSTTDEGPGIPDVSASLADGYSSVGSLGYGLGSINRLMDELEIFSAPKSGTRIVCRKWVRQPAEGFEPRNWDVAAATRAKGGSGANGDAFVIKQAHGHLLAGLIDGLGHGEPAQTAAIAAQNYVLSHDDMPLDKIFAGTDRACAGTRGVVMALAQFHSPLRMSFSSIGNVDVRARAPGEHLPFVLRRGILAGSRPHVSVQHYNWNPEWMLVFHTDGLSARWVWDDFPGVASDSAQMVTSRLMRKLATGSDDATVLAVKSAPV